MKAFSREGGVGGVMLKLTFTSCSKAPGGCRKHRGAGTMMVWGLSQCGEHCGVGSMLVQGPSWSGDHHSKGSIMKWGASWSGEHHSVGSIVMQGSSQYGEHHGLGSITAWGPWQRRHNGGAGSCALAAPGGTGNRWSWLGRGRGRRASVCGLGGSDKVPAASQAALGEAQQSFSVAKTTKGSSSAPVLGAARRGCIG